MNESAPDDLASGRLAVPLAQLALAFAAAAALLLPGPARPEQKDEPRSLDARVSTVAGAFSGLRTRTDSGGLVVVDARLTPIARVSGLELRFPVRLARHETLGADLDETLAAAALHASWRASKHLKLGAEAGFRKVWRVGWPDQYQPNPDLTLQRTRRYSYEAARGGADVYVHPAKHQHLRLRWQVTSYQYTRDPHFDPARPTHLTPRDNVQNELALSWRYLRDAWAFAARLDTNLRRDSVYPARHARTGSTRTPTATPHQALNRYEPSMELELRRLPGAVKLSLQLGWAVQDDRYEGYYSYAGPHPRVIAEWDATERLSLVAGAQAWWLRYGPSSRNPSSTVPNDDGKRLWDHAVQLDATARFKLGRGFSAIAEGAYRQRRTNYPNYVPGVFPATRLYDVKWDYDNWRAVAGLEWRT